MRRNNNTFSSFLVLGTTIAIFIVLLILLAKILVAGLAIGLFLFVCYWIKNKFMTPGSKRHPKSYAQNFYYYKDNQRTRNARSSEYYSQKSRTQGSHSENSSHPKGRIIDVEAED